MHDPSGPALFLGHTGNLETASHDEVKDIATLAVTPMGELPALFRDTTVSSVYKRPENFILEKRNDEAVRGLINM